jgi:hypothetical protein
MAFLRWLGFERIDFEFTTERLGVAIFCALLTVGATFTPLLNAPHVLLSEIPNDMSDARLPILFLEVVGIGLNLVRLRAMAAGLLVFTFVQLISNLRYTIEVTDAINASWAADPRIHYTQMTGLGWGWWLILLGPCIMAGVLIRDFLRDRAQKRS